MAFHLFFEVVGKAGSILLQVGLHFDDFQLLHASFDPNFFFLCGLIVCGLVKGHLTDISHFFLWWVVWFVEA